MLFEGECDFGFVFDDIEGVEVCCDRLSELCCVDCVFEVYWWL